MNKAGARGQALAFGVCLGAAALAACACSGAPGPRSDPEGPQQLNLAPEVEYVGREACKPCHLGIYTTYARTGMGRSFYPLTPETAVEDFTENNEFHDPSTGIRYRMERRDGKYYQRQFVLDSRGQELAADEHELVYVVGSNNHGRAYVTLGVDDRLFQAPVCWYPQASRWDLCPGFEHENDHFSREISSSCVFCHNGRMELVDDARNRYRRPFPHGIDCERCHGPGALHVERWTRGRDVASGEADPTIVNPRRLSREARMEVCFQCHLGDSKAERVPRFLRAHEQFRPGRRLADAWIPFRFKVKTQHDFGLSAQADRLILSACYSKSGGKIECLTCHDPHVSTYHEDRDPGFYRERCLTCHAVTACQAPEAQRQGTHPPDDCLACHMRRAQPDDQRFTQFTDHWIRRDIQLDSPDHRESFEIEPTLPEPYASLSPAEQAYYRGRAYVLMVSKAPPPARAAMWDQAERAFREAIDAGMDGVEPWFFLGKSRQEMGRLEPAAQAFEQALSRDPQHRDAAFALGQTLDRLGRVPQALAVFERMLALDADNPMALAEAGRLYHATGRAENALSSYERAVLGEPWNASLHLNLGMTLASLGRFDEAAQQGLAAARLDPDSRPIWEFYMNVMQAAGRPADATEGRRQLGRLAPPR